MDEPIGCCAPPVRPCTPLPATPLLPPGTHVIPKPRSGLVSLLIVVAVCLCAAFGVGVLAGLATLGFRFAMRCFT